MKVQHYVLFHLCFSLHLLQYACCLVLSKQCVVGLSEVAFLLLETTFMRVYSAEYFVKPKPNKLKDTKKLHKVSGRIGLYNLVSYLDEWPL